MEGRKEEGLRSSRRKVERIIRSNTGDARVEAGEGVCVQWNEGMEQTEKTTKENMHENSIRKLDTS